MNRKRILTLVAGVAVIAAACSGTTTLESGSSESAGEAVDVPTTSAAELFSPTDNSAPLDLTGGARSSSDGVTIVSGDPRSGLSDRVAEATAPWETDWSRRTVDAREFLLGIQAVDPRDRIPPLDRPVFEPITQATWLDDREPGALVQFNDEVRFYPLSILTRHEIVNDRFGDVPVVVTFCPLCNTAITFDARVDGESLRFGVSGLLRNSDLVMWDGSSTTLWQQITGEAVVGELAGTQLNTIPTSIVAYGDAVENFPEAYSLSPETGFDIAYGANPYRAYSSSDTPFLFDGELDERFPALSRVVGVNVEGADKAYPFSLINEQRAVNDDVGGIPIAVLWGGSTADALDATAIADGATIGSGIAFDRRVGSEVLTFVSTGDDLFEDAETGSTWTLLGRAIEGPLEGEQLTTVQHRNEFWFAWASFFPEGEVFEPL
jgi:hypothetical protein